MTSLVDRYGSWAFVAGASEGIGASFARELAGAGLSLVLVARRAGPLEALAGELRALGREVDVHALDLATPDLERELRTIAAARPIGVVVWNAALSVMAPFMTTPVADHHRMLDLNARGPLTAARVFGEGMTARGRGAIILLSSLTAFWGSAYLATYGATKAFNLSLAEALAYELGPHGIDVVASCAGATRTPGFINLIAGRKGPRAMTPTAVARATLGALRRRGAIVPGGFNRFAQLLMSRVFSRRLAIRIMAGQTKALLPG
jgi:short-subunit dehydrogenase